MAATTLRIARPPQTDDELYELIKILWGVTIPRTPVCPDHSTPFAALAEAYFARAPVAVWVGSRGMGGKSRTLAYLALTEAVLLGAEINLLGGSLEQSNNIASAMREGWDAPMAPKHMVMQDSATRLLLSNRALVRPLTASERTVRGPHPQRLRLDEIDVMDIGILDSAMGQPMPGRGLDTQTVMSSTWQVPDGTMTEILQRAEEMDWPVHRWCVGQSTLVSTQRGTVPVIEVTTADRVMTRLGWQPVQHVTYMGTKTTLTLHLSNGRSLDLTGDHQVLTPEGWVEAQALRPGGELVGIAGAAPSPSSVRGDVDVALDQRVSLATGLQVDVDGDRMLRSAGDVLRDGHIFQVIQGNAGAHPTQMVESVTDRATDQLPVGSVSHRLTVAQLPVDQSVTSAVECSLPEPTTVAVDGHPAQEVVNGQILRGQSAVAPVGAGLATDGSRIAEGTSPALAAVHVVSVSDGPIQPVYDIGVHGQHEFVAEGIVVHNCYKETSNPVDGWLSLEFIERKKQEVSAAMFANEYDLQEPAFDTRAFDTEAVEAMFVDAVHEKADVTGTIKSPVIRKNGVVERYIFEQPNRVGDYVIAADWAKESDFTVISVFRTDEEKMRLVAYTRCQRFPWPVMIGWYNELMGLYEAKGIHDGTGVGNVVNDYIDRRSFPFIMSGRQRSEMLTEYVAAVERGLIEAPRVSSAYTAHKLASFESLYNIGQDSHLPDEICSFALAWKRSGRRARFAAPVGLPRLSAGATDETINESYQAKTPWHDIGGKIGAADFGVTSITHSNPFDAVPEVAPVAGNGWDIL